MRETRRGRGDVSVREARRGRGDVSVREARRGRGDVVHYVTVSSLWHLLPRKHLVLEEVFDGI